MGFAELIYIYRDSFWQAV